MACRDGFPWRKAFLEQYYSTPAGNLLKSWLVTINNFCSVFWVVCQMWVHEIEFPFVQPQFWSCSFRFWRGELLENSVEKVWGHSRFATWWWNLRFLMKTMNFGEILWRANRTKRSDFRWVWEAKIHGGLALRAMFKHFGLCSRSCRSFSISFCPVGDFNMRI